MRTLSSDDSSRSKTTRSPSSASSRSSKDDKAKYVRRPVANNLNDIARDHPDIVVDLCSSLGKNASAERMWIIKRATRTLVKEGNRAALELLGFDPRAKIEARIPLARA